MEKRVLVTIALSLAILFGWTAIQSKYFPAPKAPTSPSSPAPQTATDSAVAPTPPGSTGTIAPTETAAPAAARAPEQRTVVERPGIYRAIFSSWGGVPVEFTLLHRQYRREIDGKDAPIDMVARAATTPLFGTTFSSKGGETERSDFDLPQGAVWTLVRQSDAELVYAIDVGEVHVEKRWELPSGGYRLGLSVAVENRGAKAIAAHLSVAMGGWQDPNVKPGGLLSFGRQFNLFEGICDIAGKLHHHPLEDAIQSPATESGDVKWIGIGEQFFVAAAAFAPDNEARSCTVRGEPTGQIVARATYAKRTIPPGQRAEYVMAGFVGPKQLDALDAVTVGGVDARLGDAVNYTFEFVARPMMWVLRKIQSVVVNWGVAIILITILLKAILFLPTQKSMASAKAMASLKPEIDRLKAQYGNDKARFNQEQMSLFKQRGINPLGGCLPMLLQMPIYIAFYSMLSNAVELYRASFVGPIDDMTAPFWPMSLATGALMFVQQKVTPMSADSDQQRIMMYTMPIMFTMFTLFLPSGLTLYILVNTVLTMAQQWWTNRGGAPLPGSRPARA